MDLYQMTKEERAERAEKWYKSITSEFKEDIDSCTQKTSIYCDYTLPAIPTIKKWNKTTVKLRNLTSEEAIAAVAKHGVTAVLNFSDYKSPGGQFLRGSKAQEESLCHHSILYPILESFWKQFYMLNHTTVNYGMYTHKMLYTEDVLFFINGEEYRADVITCAAPNFTTGIRYGSVEKSTCDRIIAERLKFIFEAAINHGVEYLILGAYGCGVFKNDPTWVAETIMKLAEEYQGHIRVVILPVPIIGGNYSNLERFKKVVYHHPLSDR